MRSQGVKHTGRHEVTALFSIGLLSLIVYAVLGTRRDWTEPIDVILFLQLLAGPFLLYAGAFLLARRGRWNGGRRRLWVILGGAVLFRLALLPAGGIDGWESVFEDLEPRGQEPAYSSFLLFDNDIWRYLWDGRVMLGGVVTYDVSPTEIEDLADDGDPRFAWLDDEPWGTIHTRIGYPSYRTIYPPLAQATFTLCAATFPGSVVAFKLLLILADLATCWFLMDLARRALGRPELALIYAWNPLAIKEIAGSAHIDALAILALVAALWLLERGREKLSLLALAAAILVKLTPLLVVPLFLQRVSWRRWWVLPAAGALAYAPFLDSLPVMVDSLRAFSKDWAFNAGFWNLALSAGQGLGLEGRAGADALCLGATLILIGWISWRSVTWRFPDWRTRLWKASSPESKAPASMPPEPAADTLRLARDAGIILGAYVLLSPTVMPWYLLWALPLLALQTGFVWPAVTALSLFSYGVYYNGVERAGVLIWEHSLIVLVLLAGYLYFRSGPSHGRAVD